MARATPRKGKAEQFDLAPPHAASLAESLRAFGYELPTAIADLVDNSIFAGARSVWIHFYWDGANSAISVVDDGCGMDESALLDAMRPGSRNPRDTRDPKDLGRFGLGLKTASFSQCRCVTVRTRKKKAEIVTRCWDLDHIAKVDEWQLLRRSSPLATKLSTRLEKLSSGTAVIWENLDRLTGNTAAEDGEAEDQFLSRADDTHAHLSCVFHRFLEGRRALKLYLNDRLIAPWDPFLAQEAATIIEAVEKLQCGEAVVEVEPFVLPHLSKLTQEKHRQAAGPRGWNLHQGFYVYRNKRLLVAGDWLGIKGWKPEEHYKLARIRVDLPNTLDHAWEIDVTKSKASPPAILKAELQRIGSRARNVAKRIYSHRGARLTAPTNHEHLLLWEQKVKHNQVFYRLNRQHPLLKAALSTSTERDKLNALFRLIEHTIPVPLITITDREMPDQTLGPFEGVQSSELVSVMKEMFQALASTGYTPRAAFDRLCATDPFARFPAELEAFAEAHGITP